MTATPIYGTQLNTDDRAFDVRLPFVTQAIALAIIPFEEVLAFSFGSALRMINFLTLGLLILYTRLDLKWKLTAPVNFLLIFLGYVVCSIYWCYNSGLYIDRLLTYSLYTLLILFLQAVNPTEKERALLLKGLYIGGIIASLILIIRPDTSVDKAGREILTLFGRTIDSNILAYSSVLALAINLYYLLYKKSKIVLRIIILVPLIYGIIALGSRGAFITAIVIIGYLSSKIEYKNNKLIKRILFVIFAALILYWIYDSFVLTSEYARRFSIDNLLGKGNLGTANRDRIWAAAFEQIVKRPILGYGNGASPYVIGEVYRFYGTHNSYIMVLLEFGVIGFLLATIWFSKIFKLCKVSDEIIYKALYISILIFVLFVEGFSSKVFWGVMIILMTCAEPKEKIRTF